MNMIKVYEKMLCKARLEKVGIHQLMIGKFALKYLNFKEIWKIPCVVQIFHVVPKFPVFPVWKN